MTQTQYYSLLTTSGHQANIKAKALGLPIVLSQVAFGSGAIVPTESATALVKEEIRVNINSIIQNETDKNILEIEAVIPSDVGGFLINEAALYLADGTLYAVANLPTSYKPSLEQGAGKEFLFTIYLASVGVENVTLKIDDSIVFATRKYVSAELKKYALKNGDKTQIFKVKDAVNIEDAVNKKQLAEAIGLIGSPQVFQTVYAKNSTYITTTLVIPADGSIPQISEGYEFLSLSIKPKKKNSRFKIDITIFAQEISSNAADIITMALFRNSEPDAVYYSGFVNTTTHINGTSNTMTGTVSFIIDNTSLDIKKFTVRVGMNSTATLQLNRVNYASSYQNNVSNIIITEIAE